MFSVLLDAQVKELQSDRLHVHMQIEKLKQRLMEAVLAFFAAIEIPLAASQVRGEAFDLADQSADCITGLEWDGFYSNEIRKVWCKAKFRGSFADFVLTAELTSDPDGSASHFDLMVTSPEYSATKMVKVRDTDPVRLADQMVKVRDTDPVRLADQLLHELAKLELSTYEKEVFTRWPTPAPKK